MEWAKRSVKDFSAAEYDRCFELMAPDRCKYIQSITNDNVRNSSVLGEWMIKNLLAERTGIPLDEIILCRTLSGKPYAKDISTNFSISHSGEWVVAAVDDEQIGIDIEVIRSVDLRVTKRLCTDSDMKYMSENGITSEDSNQNEILKRFFEIWTAKEAYFKKIGTGITDLRSISYCDLNPIHFYEDNCIITIIKQ